MVVAAEVQVVRQELKKLLHGQARIEHRSEGDLLRAQKIAQAFQHGSLTGSDFARQYDEAFAALHAVNQVRQGLFVLHAPEQKRRVRAHVERVLVETEKG